MILRRAVPPALRALLLAFAVSLLAAPAQASLPSLGDLARASDELQARPSVLSADLPRELPRDLPKECNGPFCVGPPETRVGGFDLRLSCQVGGEAGVTCTARPAWGLVYGGRAVERSVFTGHVFDTETGLYYAKARYFDPKLGRFLTQDSFLGQIDEPPSLHRYAYAANRPTFYVDPTGHFSLKAAGETLSGIPRAIAEPALEVYDVALVTGAKIMGIPPEHIELQSALGRRQQGRIEEGQSVSTAAVKGSAEAVAAAATRGLSVIGQAYAETAIDYSKGTLTIEQLDDRLTSIGVGVGAGAALGAAGERLSGKTWTGRQAAKPTRIIEGSSGNGTEVPAATEAPPAVATGESLSRPTARQLAIHRRINERAALAQEKGPFFVNETPLTASLDDLQALAAARAARFAPGATPNTIGGAGEVFGEQMTRGHGVPHVRLVDSTGRARILDLEVPSRVNFEIKNTSRPQAATRFFLEQLAADRRLMQSSQVSRTIVVGTGGFTRGARAAAQQAGAELVDLRDFP